jgi:hypothetical protein
MITIGQTSPASFFNQPSPRLHWLTCLLLLLFLQSFQASAEEDMERAAGNIGFFTDLRSYFFQRDFKGGTTDREDLSLGGIIRLTGVLNPTFAFGLSFYLSNGLGLNDDDKDVYSLLAKDDQGDHENYEALGEGYLRYRHERTTLTLGRQELRTPWLNLHDVRMTPQSFEALALSHEGIPDMKITLAHVTRMKKKNETGFRAMSDIIASDGDEPVTLVGFDCTGFAPLRLQLWDYLGHELWNDLYLKLGYEKRLKRNLTLLAGMRYLQRRSIGQELAGHLDTYHAGLIAGVKTGNFKIHFAWSKNGDQDIDRSWGHDTTISNQVYVADRAREEAWLAGFDYRFSQLGLPGLKAALLYAQADTPDNGAYASADRAEVNLDLQYNFSETFKGLSLRARHAIIHEWGVDTAEDVTDTRLQLRYQRSY